MSAGSVSAIILAGNRPGGDPMAQSRKIPVKALIPVAGQAMVSRVIKALMAHEKIGKIHLLAQDFAPFWDHDQTQKLVDNPQVSTHISQTTIATSLDTLLGSQAIEYPVLITTADNVLLEQAIIDEFLAKAAGTDIAIAVVAKPVLLHRFSHSQRTWLKLRGGQFSGANLFYFGSPKARQILHYWAQVEQDRKKGWKLLTIFGPWLLFLAIIRWLNIDQLAARIGKKLSLNIKIAQMSQAEACIDVDKESDLLLVEEILAGRASAAGQP
ncbi:MAG: NTP transferase domain-containing protein [Parasphingorhabdus sp.]|uniref:NTP transferase domain-containing protein n=1 Tax=Parasphingorhabdus sp. TaxID=2709688 RepID=UPI003298DFE2